MEVHLKKEKAAKKGKNQRMPEARRKRKKNGKS